MADAGYNPIIGVGFAYSDAVDAVAPEYPDINFGVVDGFDPTTRGQQQRRLPRLRRERGLLPRRCRGCREDQVRPHRLRGRCPQRPHQEVRGRLHRGRQGRQPEDQGRRHSTSRRPTSSGFNDPAGGKAAAAAMYDKVRTWSSTPRARRDPASSTRRSTPATASGRSASTPTSTSPRRPTRSRTSSPRCSSASTWRPST